MYGNRNFIALHAGWSGDSLCGDLGGDNHTRFSAIVFGEINQPDDEFIRVEISVWALTNGFEWSLKNTAFYNQVTIGYEDQFSNKSIKVFPNGSFQVAGCSDLPDCKRIVRQLTHLVQQALELEEPPKTEPFRVVMINTNFSLNSSVNLNKIIAKFAKIPGFKVTFDPDRYSAVKVKFVPGPGMKQVTASIFVS